jgi:cytochrome oxidase Cu insertion factor (SCO1/SenC/PrrC family)
MRVRGLGGATGLLLAAVLGIGPALAAAAPAAAPAFALELFNGQTLRLADLKGTAVVLLFWTNW